MPACSSCESRKVPCLASEKDSSRCADCVRYKRGNCDFQGLSPAQMQKLVAQHSVAEAELETAEEELEAVAAKVRRLRQQRRLWSDKIAQAMRRGLDTIEELDRVEAEEARAAEAAQQSDIAVVEEEPRAVPDGDPTVFNAV